MARMPGATWKPVCNYSRGQIGKVVGMVVHHMVGSEGSAYAHFNTPGSGASAHFGVCYDGTTYQYVDTADAAYHACQANYQGQVGVENESPGSGPNVWQALTDEQVSANARIAAWLHDEHGIELRVASAGDRRGVGYHSMVPGDCSVAWGQTGCPGDAIVAQRDEIVRRAQGGGTEPTTEVEDDMTVWVCPDAGKWSGAWVQEGPYMLFQFQSVNAVTTGRIAKVNAAQMEMIYDDVQAARKAAGIGVASRSE